MDNSTVLNRWSWVFYATFVSPLPATTEPQTYREKVVVVEEETMLAVAAVLPYLRCWVPTWNVLEYSSQNPTEIVKISQKAPQLLIHPTLEADAFPMGHTTTDPSSKT